MKELEEKPKFTKIAILRTDNGEELSSATVQNFMKQCNIVNKKTTSYTPQQNRKI